MSHGQTGNGRMRQGCDPGMQLWLDLLALVIISLWWKLERKVGDQADETPTEDTLLNEVRNTHEEPRNRCFGYRQHVCVISCSVVSDSV